ncbi:MAG: DUF1905 domain-containing protein [bacterium]
MNYLVDEEFLVEKFPGKGGWTYISIPQISASKNSPFGWVRITGFVDDYEIKQYKLMPMGGGKLFFAFKIINQKTNKERAR